MGPEKRRGYIVHNSYSQETLKEKINRLNKNIELCREYKEETIKYVQRLKDQYSKGIFNYAEYEYMLNRYLKGYSLDYWMQYYEFQEERVKEKIKSLRLQKQKTIFEKQRLIEKKHQIRTDYRFISYSLIMLILALVSIAALYQVFEPSLENLITGFSISEINEAEQTAEEQAIKNVSLNHAPAIEAYTPEENPSIRIGESQTFTITVSDLDSDELSIRWYVNILPVADQISDSFTFTPTEPGEFEIRVLVHDFKDYTSHKWALAVEEEKKYAVPEINETGFEETNITLPEENESEETFEINETAENITLPETEPTLENLTIPEDIPELENATTPENITEGIETENITLPFTAANQMPAEINKPVRWVIRVKTNETPRAVEIPAQATAISVERIIKVPTLQLEEIRETVPKENLTIKKYEIAISLSAYELTDQSTTGFFIANIQSKGLLSTITDWTSFKFLIYKTVMSIQKASSKIWNISPLTTFATAIGEEKIILIIEDDAEEFEISYQTPAPKIKEKEEENKKIVTVYSDINYTNILTYTSIKEGKNILNVYWPTEGINISYDVHDENLNGVTDKVSWITPHLSEQTFEVVFDNQSELVNYSKEIEFVNYSQEIIPVSKLNYFINCPGAKCGSNIEEGYIEGYNYFCAVTNSKYKEADLSAGLEFMLNELPEQYDVAELCLYASSTARPVYKEGAPKIHIKKEDTDFSVLLSSIKNEMDDLPLREVSNVPGWNCFDITGLVKNALSNGETSLKLRIAGHNLKAKPRDQYACFMGLNSDAIGCSEEEQEGMSKDCRPVLQLKWK